MKKNLVFLFLLLSFTALAQVAEPEVLSGDEAEIQVATETFEQEMLAQKQEDLSTDPSLFSEEFQVEDEIDVSEGDYNY